MKSRLYQTKVNIKPDKFKKGFGLFFRYFFVVNKKQLIFVG